MKWFKATRCSGEKEGVGEFAVEDSDGVVWQITAYNSKEEDGMINRICLTDAVCMNRGYECGTELCGDLKKVVADLISTEFFGRGGDNA